MTHLPYNPLIWVEDLPEDINYWELAVNYVLRQHKIYPGTWKLICLGLQATEEEAREIVEKDGIDIAGMVFDGYCNYVDLQMVDTAVESLASLITANGWKNPVFLSKEN